MTIFQFYEGEMKPQTEAAINDLKNKAERAGWKHELYDLQRLLSEIDDEPTREAIKRMWRFLPLSMAASATSDFFRYFAATKGERVIYADDDVYCTTEDFPALPTDGVWTCSEQTHRQNINTCITLTNGREGQIYGGFMMGVSAQRLKDVWLGSFEQCRLNAQALKASPWSLINYIGPGLVRACLPHLAKLGIDVQRFPYELSSSHDQNSILFHLGSGTWCYGGKGNPNAQKLEGVKQ